jgi:F-type H+-transporting ATPase subunit gamma
LEKREVKNELVVVLSTDKGLCGGLNTNLLREVTNFDTQTTKFISVGRKGTQFLARTKRNMIADFPLKEHPTFLETKVISKFFIERFLSGEVDKVTVLFPRFVNTLTQKPTAVTLLPITSLEEAGLPGDLEPPIPEPPGDIIFEPSPEKILENIVPYYVHFELFQMLLSTRASEHSARMVAMKSATDNAKEIVKDLTLEYNKERQANITKELLEITTAQLALG